MLSHEVTESILVFIPILIEVDSSTRHIVSVWNDCESVNIAEGAESIDHCKVVDFQCVDTVLSIPMLMVLLAV